MEENTSLFENFTANNKPLNSKKSSNFSKQKRQENAILPFSEYSKYKNSKSVDYQLNDQDENDNETKLIPRIIYLHPFNNDSILLNSKLNNKKLANEFPMFK